MRLPRVGVRTRLTALYALLFLACGLATIALNYGLLKAAAFRPPGSIGSGIATPRPTAGGPAGATGSEELLRSRERDTVLRKQLTSSLVGLGVMSVAAVALGWVVAGRALRPVHEITAAARRASGHNLRERLAFAGPHDELRELADTLNGLLGRLEAAFDVQRRFSASASRELRIPLAAMRDAIDGALAEPDAERYQLMAARVHQAVARAERLVDGLLTLARSEEQPRDAEPADLADAASDALAVAAGAAAGRGLRPETSLAPAPVVGVRSLIERAVAELIANAVDHNRTGGLLEIRTGVGDDGAFLVVRNDGPAVRPEAVDSLFEPFHRHGGGAGLGLAIARSVADRHGGRLEVVARPSGGLDVRLSLRARD